jgi:hypothetical protein
LDRLRHRDTLFIPQLQHGFVQGARQSPAAEVGTPIPNAFLVRKANHLDSEREAVPVLTQSLDAGNASEDAEGPVEFPGVANRIKV